jgi:hypothetical protein
MHGDFLFWGLNACKWRYWRERILSGNLAAADDNHQPVTSGMTQAISPDSGAEYNDYRIGHQIPFSTVCIE